MYLLPKRHINRFPNELIAETFDYLDFYDLLHAAHVCDRWRDLAIEHRRFWKIIGVTSARRGTLELLALRLAQAQGRPFILDVDIPDMDVLITKTLLGLICAVIDTVDVLHIKLNAMYLTEIWSLLSVPAPRVREFELMLYSPDRLLPGIAINPTIFEGSAARLQWLYITDVIIPFYTPTGQIPAFSSVTSLTYVHPSSSTQRFPNYIFDYCPRLTLLDLRGGTMSFEEGVSPRAQEGLARLKFLTVSFLPSSIAQFVRRVPIGGVVGVLLSEWADFDTTYDVLAPLRSPFNVALVPISVPSAFWLMIQDDRSGHERIFEEKTSTYHAPPEDNLAANPLFDNEEFYAQLESLTISVSLWALMIPYLSFYDGVTKLVLEFDGDTANSLRRLPRETRSWPQLSILRLQSSTIIHLQVADLIDFADRIAPQCETLELYHNVVIDGPKGLLVSRFPSVARYMEPKWPLHRDLLATQT